jgi:hypothetical protein
LIPLKNSLENKITVLFLKDQTLSEIAQKFIEQLNAYLEDLS